MAHKNFHTKSCVFTAPDTHSAYRPSQAKTTKDIHANKMYAILLIIFCPGAHLITSQGTLGCVKPTVDYCNFLGVKIVLMWSRTVDRQYVKTLLLTIMP